MREYSTPAPAERLRLILAADLTTGEKLVLVALAGHLGRGAWVWPSQETIARKASMHRDGARKLLRSLANREIITSKPRGRGRQYRIHWHRLTATPGLRPGMDSTTPGVRPGEHRVSGPVCPPDTGPQARQNTTCLNTSKGTHGDGSSETRVPKPSRSRGGWPGGDIRPDELQDIGRAESRFKEAIASGWITEEDRLRFLTLWLYVARQNVRSRGAVLTSLVKRRDWHGSNADEDAAREHIRQASRRRPPEGGIVGSVAAALAPPADLIAAGRNLDDEP